MSSAPLPRFPPVQILPAVGNAVDDFKQECRWKTVRSAVLHGFEGLLPLSHSWTRKETCGSSAGIGPSQRSPRFPQAVTARGHTKRMLAATFGQR